MVQLEEALQLQALDPECTYPSTQNDDRAPNPEKRNANPNSQFQTANSKSRQLKTNPTFPPFPLHGLLSHFTNSRPTLPVCERTHVKRFSGSGREQSGHVVKGPLHNTDMPSRGPSGSHKQSWISLAIAATADYCRRRGRRRCARKNEEREEATVMSGAGHKHGSGGLTRPLMA